MNNFEIINAATETKTVIDKTLFLSILIITFLGIFLSCFIYGIITNKGLNPLPFAGLIFIFAIIVAFILATLGSFIVSNSTEITDIHYSINFSNGYGITNFMNEFEIKEVTRISIDDNIYHFSVSAKHCGRFSDLPLK